ncbi:MAG TPA: Hsp20/alpha crystallin family protein [Spirochaetia bacterium]|nr:Hsp20/alpha crystallin family protein [Spirochaetia bacterium]
MTNRVFTFDLGRIMDEAFKFAENFGDSFGPEAEEKLRQAAEQFGRGPFGNPDYYPAYLYPPATIYLTKDKRLVLEMALAGFSESDLTVQFRGDHLLFSARAPKLPEPEEGVQYFKRRLKLKDIEEQRYYVPADKFDQAGTEASFHSGMLRLVVPPRLQTSTGDEIRIQIKSAGEPASGA